MDPERRALDPLSVHLFSILWSFFGGNCQNNRLTHSSLEFIPPSRKSWVCHCEGPRVGGGHKISVEDFRQSSFSGRTMISQTGANLLFGHIFPCIKIKVNGPREDTSLATPSLRIRQWLFDLDLMIYFSNLDASYSKVQVSLLFI